MSGSKSRCPPLDDPSMQWLYCPSVTGAIIVTAIFGILTLAHFVQAIIYRKKFCWVIIMAAAWELTGFIMRILGAKTPTSHTFAIGSNLLIILSPLWVNAFAYMVMGRLVYHWLPTRSIWKVKARTMTKWFVWFDVISFFIQAGGGSLLDGDDANLANIGKNVYMGGIGLQQAFLTLFFCIMIKFNIEVRRIGIHRPTSWQTQLYALYAVLLLITTRIIFRLVEFTAGAEGPIPRNESFVYALEAFPMLLAITVFAVFHPGRSLVGPESEFSKMIVEKGKRRWWCCGRRTRTKIDPDVEMNEWPEHVAGSPPDAEPTQSHHHAKHKKHHGRRHSSRRRSQALFETTRAV